jgi:hypothetical protein
VSENTVWGSETSQKSEICHGHSQVTASTITSEDDMLKFHSELFLGLCCDPNVGLVAIIDRVRVGVSWRKTVINAENWDV